MCFKQILVDAEHADSKSTCKNTKSTKTWRVWSGAGKSRWWYHFFIAHCRLPEPLDGFVSEFKLRIKCISVWWTKNFASLASHGYEYQFSSVMTHALTPSLLLSPSHLFQKVTIWFSTEHIPSRLVILSRTNCQIVHQTYLRFFWRDNLAKGSW